MEIQTLKYFVEVCRNKNFSRAASLLYVTQPMLTRSVKRLEEELGVKLIERTTKTFYLTDAGVVLFKAAESLLLHYGELYKVVDDVKNVKKGSVKICIPGAFLDAFFPPLLAQFHRLYPGVNVRIMEYGSKSVAFSIDTGETDMGLISMPLDESDFFEFEVKELIKDECQVMVSARHPFAQKSSLHIRDLKDERILMFGMSATIHDMFVNTCKEYGFTPRIVYESTMTYFSLKMVEEELCIAILPKRLVPLEQWNELVALPLRPHLYSNIAIIRRRKGYKSFAAQALFDFICEYFATLNNPQSGGVANKIS